MNITLYQCILKSDKNEYIIQKATELGVNRIVFVETERTVVKLDEKKWIKKQNRFEKIALESSKESKRTSIPEIEGLLNIDEISNQDNSLSLVFYENETESIHSLLTNSNYKKKTGTLIPKKAVRYFLIENYLTAFLYLYNTSY